MNSPPGENVFYGFGRSTLLGKENEGVFKSGAVQVRTGGFGLPGGFESPNLDHVDRFVVDRFRSESRRKSGAFQFVGHAAGIGLAGEGAYLHEVASGCGAG